MFEPLPSSSESVPGPNQSGAILVVDDEAEIRTVLEDTLGEEGYSVRLAADAQEAEAQVRVTPPDMVLLDIWMPRTDGMDLLRRWVADGPLPFPVVMMSGHSTIESAVEATRLGAYDYLEKPLSLNKLLLTAEHATEAVRLRRENESLRNGAPGAVLVGDSAPMAQLRHQIERLAGSQGAVLIAGEPGVGKEAAARALHERSGLSGPFIAINSAAIAPDGMETQLFGRELEERSQPGRFEQADGGVLFLDEVADMQADVQARLVRVLEEQRFTRVGGNDPVHVDVRVVAATNRDLDGLVREGAFRSDLYYRLNVLPITVPPLRDHAGDIPALVDHFLQRQCQREGLRSRTFDKGALDALAEHAWLGNVRELENVLERILILSEADPVGAGDVRDALGSAARPQVPERLFEAPLRQAREDFERCYLAYHLRANGGNITRTSAEAGLERTHLYRKLKQLGIEAGQFKNGDKG
ncbi:sigma-54-dependent transcriptional regulator [Thiohalorhabdus sp.]|uniref:sigma-54-dependent transcriptional regulator n=1 Tax=Thiohalorhabdus sp. TaxID=3094134 RepID=UPI002FC369B1